PLQMPPRSGLPYVPGCRKAFFVHLPVITSPEKLEMVLAHGMAHADGLAAPASRTAGPHHFASPSLRCVPAKSLPPPPPARPPSRAILDPRPARPSADLLPSQGQTSGGYHGFNRSTRFEPAKLLRGSRHRRKARAAQLFRPARRRG